MTDTQPLGRITLAELVTIFDSLFDQEAYRLETLDYYASTLYQSWLRREPYDRAEWDEMLAEHKRAGKRLHRVHLLPDVLTDYLMHELDFYRGSVQAGEDIRVMRKADAPAGIPEGYDYWLFDRKLAAVMEYDSNGICTSVDLTASPATVRNCVRWRNEAMATAMTLADYDRKAATCKETGSSGKATTRGHTAASK